MIVLVPDVPVEDVPLEGIMHDSNNLHLVQHFLDLFKSVGVDISVEFTQDCTATDLFLVLQYIKDNLGRLGKLSPTQTTKDSGHFFLCCLENGEGFIKVGFRNNPPICS